MFQWLQNLFGANELPNQFREPINPVPAVFRSDGTGFTIDYGDLSVFSPTLKAATIIRASAVGDSVFEVENSPEWKNYFDSISTEQFFYQIEYYSYIWGAAYIVKESNGPDISRIQAGMPNIALRIVHPFWVKPQEDPSTSGAGSIVRGYLIDGLNNGREVPSEDVIVIPAHHGEGALKRLAYWLEIEKNSLRGKSVGSRYLASLSIILKKVGFDRIEDEAERQAFQKRVQALADDTAAMEDRARVGVIPIDMETEDIMAFERPVDEAFESIQKMVTLRVATDSGVSPSDLGIIEFNRYSNIYQKNRQFYNNVVKQRHRHIAKVLGTALGFDCHFEAPNLEESDQESAVALLRVADALLDLPKTYDRKTVQELGARYLGLEEYGDPDPEDVNRMQPRTNGDGNTRPNAPNSAENDNQ